ncbi:MAG: hypothetical protein FD127_3452, partial [Acidimicrobiaceae bacterium]
MARLGGEGHIEGHLAQVPIARLHHRRLADQHQVGSDRSGGREMIEQATDPGASDLLVVRQGEVHGVMQICWIETAEQLERDGDEALHVGGAPAEQQISLAGDGVCRMCPSLAGRNHIRVRRQKNATGTLRAEGGEQVGAAGRARKDLDSRAGGIGAIGNPFQQGDVRRAALRDERDQPGQRRDRGVGAGHTSAA